MKRVMILLAIIVVVALISSCQIYRAAAAEKGAEASDAALETALWSICNAIPVGAIKRHFKTDEEKDAYNAICPENPLP